MTDVTVTFRQSGHDPRWSIRADEYMYSQRAKAIRVPQNRGALREVQWKDERPEYWRAFRRGVQRGFEGSIEVPDAEHRTLLHHEDADTRTSYSEGVAYGQTLLRGHHAVLDS